MKRLIAGVVGLGCSLAQAALVMEFRELGTRVEGRVSGSLDLSGMWGLPGFTASLTGVYGALGWASFGAAPAAQTNFNGEFTGPSAFGTGLYALGEGQGDAVFLQSNSGDLWLPQDYVSGAPLSGTLTFANASLASLGLLAGEYVYTFTSGDHLTLQIGTGSVPPAELPVPGTVPLVLGALGALSAVVLRRRR